MNKFWITAPLPQNLTPVEYDALRTFLAANATAAATLTAIELSPQLNQATLTFHPNTHTNAAQLHRVINTWQRHDLVTQAAAAAALNIPIKRINTAIREGRLPAYIPPHAPANPRHGARLVSLTDVRELWPQEE